MDTQEAGQWRSLLVREYFDLNRRANEVQAELHAARTVGNPDLACAKALEALDTVDQAKRTILNLIGILEDRLLD